MADKEKEPEKNVEKGSGSGSSSTTRPSIGNAKFEVEKFNGTNNFGMWQCEMMDVLCQQELDIALDDKPEDMNDAEWAKINWWACGSIRLCLAKDQKFFVMKETSAKICGRNWRISTCSRVLKIGFT